MIVKTKAMVVANDGIGLTGVTQKTGSIKIEYTTTTHNSAVFYVYDNAGTVTTVLGAGSSGVFTITKGTGSRVNVYYEGGEIRVENKLGETIKFFATCHMI